MNNELSLSRSTLHRKPELVVGDREESTGKRSRGIRLFAEWHNPAWRRSASPVLRQSGDRDGGRNGGPRRSPESRVVEETAAYIEKKERLRGRERKENGRREREKETERAS